MQLLDNILDHQNIAFGDAENVRLLRFQSTDNQYRYSRKITPNSTGKELDAETGFSYFGARYLDHTLTTAWLSVDPMADKYPSVSPYAYCMWNPLITIDPSGMDTIVTINIDNGEVGMQCYDEYVGNREVRFISNDGNTIGQDHKCTGNVSYYNTVHNTVVEFDNADDAEIVYNKLSGKENGNVPSSVEWSYYKNIKKYTSKLVTSHKIDEVDVSNFLKISYMTIEYRHYHPYNTNILYYLPSEKDFKYSEAIGIPCFLDYCGKSYRFDNIKISGNYSPNRIKDIIKEKYGIEYLFCK